MTIISAVIFTGCGAGGGSNDKESPQLSSCVVTAGCTGGESDQYVDAKLTFDKDVSADDSLADELRVVIGGSRISSSDMKISQDDPSDIDLKISVTQVNNGVIEITPAKEGKALAHLTDSSGAHHVAALDVKKLIPSGVAVEMKTAEGTGSTAVVTAPPSHRSIAWIQISENGSPLTPEAQTADVMDNAVAVHEHDFLWATTETTAADIAKAVNDFYPSQLHAEAAGSEITITNTGSSAAGAPQLSVYSF